MWLIDKIFGKSFERNLKNLANDIRIIAGYISETISREGNDLRTLEEESKKIIEGTKIITSLYNNIEQKKSNVERERVHDPGNSSIIAEEMRAIIDEEKLLREVGAMNSDIYHDTANQIDLLKQTHQISLGLRDVYIQIVQNSHTITNQQSIIAINHLLENIKTFSNQKITLDITLEQIRADKEKRRTAIIERCKKMRMDDEAVKKIAGQLIMLDKKDRKISSQIPSIQLHFSH